MGVCTSINFNLHPWHEIKFCLSDNPPQKETIDEIILAQENKVCNLQIRYRFRYNSCCPVNGAKNQLLLPEGYP